MANRRLNKRRGGAGRAPGKGKGSKAKLRLPRTSIIL